MGLSVVIITKNEERSLVSALQSVAFADEIIVLDSHSTDQTRASSEGFGAKFFESFDWPGFGIQKNRVLAKASEDWVLSLDADEWLSADLANEIQAVIKSPASQCDVNGYWIRRLSIFIDKPMYFGDWRGDRILRLFRRPNGRFSEDVVHERLLLDGKCAELRGVLHHHPIKALSDSRRRMWRYNLTAARSRFERKPVGWASPWLHGGWSIFRSLVLRLGFLDGKRGLQLSWYNSKGTFIRYEATLRRQRPNRPAGFKRLRAYLNLFLFDHGILRSIYSNHFGIPGPLFRCNQPSPSKLLRYAQRLRIKTVVNLRGANPQLGWYQLESHTCQSLEIHLINTQVHSRGLPTRSRIYELKQIIETMELPANAHCKSGADRVGFFSVLFRHWRLGEPIETARKELHWRFGHFRSAKTGVLDFFFEAYLNTREPNQSFINWVDSVYNREQLEADFSPKGLADFFVNVVLRRE